MRCEFDTRPRLLGMVVAVVAAATLAATDRVDAANAAGTPLDIEIAIDGTASMRASIDRAERDGRAIVAGVHRIFPNSRFSVVVFRDFGSDGAEYELLQPFTADSALVEAALERVTTATNRSLGNGLAESYNLLFRMSYTDTRLEWRREAKKLEVVIGDAEPQSAGRLGLPGCRDTAADQHGLSTEAELAKMRAAGRTLLMVRQLGKETSSGLECYESLAARAAPGGAAIDAGNDLVAPIVALVKRAIAPVTVRGDRHLVRPGAIVKFTLTVSNATSDPLQLDQLGLTLPVGFIYQRGSTRGAATINPSINGRILTWRQRGRTLRTGEQLRLAVSARVIASLGGRYRAQGRAIVETAYGERLLSASAIYGITLRRVQPAVRR